MVVWNFMSSLEKILFPICRSLSGEGVRETLRLISDEIGDLDIIETPTGKKVFDWTIPGEWNIRDAWIKDAKGVKIIDFKKNNLHVVSYSQPVNSKLKLDQFKDNLHFIEDLPDVIPYRTSYYDKNWGFCLSYNQYCSLSQKEDYEVFIDASTKKGSISHGEYLIKGKTNKTVVISTYVCHPSMANDNLSGMLTAVNLIKKLKRRDNYYSYKILFLPETIGSINWLHQNYSELNNIVAGFVLTCTGDDEKINFKKSRKIDSSVNKAALYVSKFRNDFNIIDYYPLGSDERQYCSPGFDLPFCTIMRSIPGKFEEYHTSADDLNFISVGQIDRAANFCIDIIDVIESNLKFKNKIMYCEPQLGKRGLYRTFGGKKLNSEDHKAIKWILNMSDGKNDLIDISVTSKIKLKTLKEISKILVDKDLIEIFN